jgi:tRNA/rRNA methyltransferase
MSATSEALAVSEKPVIVLVRPQLGENIGKAARAMLNFGLVDMRLVAPRDGWPNPSAGPAASGADIVLERATVYETLADAVADCAHVYATTVRKRGVTKPVLTPEQAASEIHVNAPTGRSALVFGPERSGLETDDVALAHAIVTVPINPEFGSLNLAQAVILLAYEWSKGVGKELAQPTLEEQLPPPPGGSGGHDRPSGRAAGAQGLFLPRNPRRRHPAYLAQPADKAALEPSGSAHHARRALLSGQQPAAGRSQD